MKTEMRATIKNITAGIITFPEFSLKRGESTTVNFTPVLKTYEQQHYIKIEKLTPGSVQV